MMRPRLASDSSVDIQALLGGTDLTSFFEDDGHDEKGDGISPATSVNPTLPHKATDRFVRTSGDTVQQYSNQITRLRIRIRP